jgi:NitT/TauT family transport system substrate-binding protein
VLARRVIVLAIVVGGLALAVGCSSGSGARTDSDDVVRLGYTADLTQVPALVGVDKGLFAEYLSPERRVEAAAMTGSTAVEQLLGGTLDAAYLGPRDAIDAYRRSGGRGIRIVAGATSGGAALVVRPGIASVADLGGTSIAVPRRGSAEDVALRAFLADNGLQVVVATVGDVAVVPQPNGRTLEMFRAGAIGGAWVPEPWATRLVLEGGGSVLADERALWPDGEFATTELVVRTEFLERHRDAVRGLLEGHVRAVNEATENPVEAQRAANAVLRAQTGAALPDEIIAEAWDNLSFTNDPIAGSLQKSVDDDFRIGAGEQLNLAGMYDLTLVNEVLALLGQDKVSS